MKLIFPFLFLTTASLTLACGRQKSESVQASPAPAPVSDNNQYIRLSGFVGNAFEVTVDAVQYDDLEDFYTKELDRLPQKVRDSGLEGNFTVRFEAAIGFKDLWSNMMVYIAPDASKGYQANSQVTSSGEFLADFPVDAEGDTFKVRATKRIRVIIMRGRENLSYCYNFSAQEKAIVLEKDQKPVILDTFSTSLTKYDCPLQSQAGGIQIPQSSEPMNHQIRPGLTKSELNELLDSTGLVVYEKKWCWAIKPGQVVSNCAVSMVSACSCSLIFDDNDKLISQVNIASQLLDIGAW